MIASRFYSCLTGFGGFEELSALGFFCRVEDRYRQGDVCSSRGELLTGSLSRNLPGPLTSRSFRVVLEAGEGLLVIFLVEVWGVVSLRCARSFCSGAALERIAYSAKGCAAVSV